MMENKKVFLKEKSGLYLCNCYCLCYDFDVFLVSCFELIFFLVLIVYGDIFIDFVFLLVVKMLNKVLLKYFYGIEYWDILVDFLCLLISGCVDYVYYLVDLLVSCNDGVIL